LVRGNSLKGASRISSACSNASALMDHTVTYRGTSSTEHHLKTWCTEGAPQPVHPKEPLTRQERHAEGSRYIEDMKEEKEQRKANPMTDEEKTELKAELDSRKKLLSPRTRYSGPKQELRPKIPKDKAGRHTAGVEYLRGGQDTTRKPINTAPGTLARDGTVPHVLMSPRQPHQSRQPALMEERHETGNDQMHKAEGYRIAEPDWAQKCLPDPFHPPHHTGPLQPHVPKAALTREENGQLGTKYMRDVQPPGQHN